MALAFFGLASAAPPPSVESVKATYLVKFAPFVDWPPSAPGAPFVICVVGEDPFGPELDSAAAGQAAHGRPIAVRRMARADASADCQIAYVAGSPAFVRSQLSALRGSPTLTVTDDAGAVGVIDFQLIQNRVRFRVDDAAAAANGLTISSKLLDIALAVRPRPRTPS